MGHFFHKGFFLLLQSFVTNAAIISGGEFVVKVFFTNAAFTSLLWQTYVNNAAIILGFVMTFKVCI